MLTGSQQIGTGTCYYCLFSAYRYSGFGVYHQVYMAGVGYTASFVGYYPVFSSFLWRSFGRGACMVIQVGRWRPYISARTGDVELKFLALAYFSAVAHNTYYMCLIPIPSRAGTSPA